MNLKEKILSTHSKSNSNEIVEWVGNSQKRMKLLLHIFFGTDTRASQRAAMAVGDIARLRPSLIKPHLHQLVRNLTNPQHDAIIRNTVRIFQEVEEIPEELQGELYERCFEYLTSKKYPTAVKAFSVTVLRRIAHIFPELREELIYAIEEQIPQGTVGFKNRAKKELKLLRSPVKKSD